MNRRHVFVALATSVLAVAASSSAEPVFPLDTDRRALSASFGEYRPGRLHAGIDFATFGKSEIPVRAVENGRIVRVRSSTGGYGNVVYLEHAGGRRTTYAHLSSFSQKIASLLPRPAHPLGGDYNGTTMEIYPAIAVSAVRKGEIIGRSGESGVGIPHFHFELRDTNDRPLNPIRNGIVAIEDKVPPEIDAVMIEPADESSSVEGSGRVWTIDTAAREARVRAAGRVRILVMARDDDGRLGGTMGIDSLRMTVNGSKWSEVAFRSFTFGRDDEAVHLYDPFHSGFGPTNYAYDMTGPDGAAEALRGKGILTIDSGATLAIRLDALDAKGNRATRRFTLTHDGRRAAATPPAREDGLFITRGGIVISKNGIEARVTENGLYTDVAIVPAGRAAARHTIAGGARIRLEGHHPAVYTYSGFGIEPPPHAVGMVLHLGPYGSVPTRKAEVALPVPDVANGLAFFANGSWRWRESSRHGTELWTDLDFLAPLVAVRDTAAPTVEADTARPGWVSIEDDFSGVNAEKVAVNMVENGARRILKGRYDSDRRSFIPDSERRVAHGAQLHVAAEDRAGNRIEKVIVIERRERR